MVVEGGTEKKLRLTTLVDQQARQLKEKNPDGVRSPERVFRIDQLQDEGRDDVLRVFWIRSRRTSDQLLAVAVLEAQREARDDDELESQDFFFNDAWCKTANSENWQ